MGPYYYHKKDRAKNQNLTTANNHTFGPFSAKRIIVPNQIRLYLGDLLQKINNRTGVIIQYSRVV